MDESQIGLKDGELWIETFTGKYVNPLDLHPEDIDIHDIAHHLSLLCRFNGACRTFYSVAQHSLLASALVDKQFSLEALLHDSSEAYMNDMTRPVKWGIPKIKEFEDKILNRILARFNIVPGLTSTTQIKYADNILLAMEARDLMKSKGKGWYLPDLPSEDVIIPWSSETAEVVFLDRFAYLQGG